MFEFNSRSGVLTQNGKSVDGGDQCYSGTGAGRNNPDLESLADVGPVPRGKYKIGPVYDDPHLGPLVMHLDPLPGTNDYGRTLFRIHGNNAANDASHGCVIAPRTVREIVNLSRDRILTVTSGGNNETPTS